MSCDSSNHNMHMCALKAQNKLDCIAELSNKASVQCRKCGAKANSPRNLCGAHLLDEAPNVEGGHGVLGLDQIGKPHSG